MVLGGTKGPYVILPPSSQDLSGTRQSQNVFQWGGAIMALSGVILGRHGGDIAEMSQTGQKGSDMSGCLARPTQAAPLVLSV